MNGIAAISLETCVKVLLAVISRWACRSISLPRLASCAFRSVLAEFTLWRVPCVSMVWRAFRFASRWSRA
jgi:hypothetical protein